MNEESKRLSNFLNKNKFYIRNLNSRKKFKKIKFEFIYIVCNSISYIGEKYILN